MISRRRPFLGAALAVGALVACSSQYASPTTAPAGSVAAPTTTTEQATTTTSVDEMTRLTACVQTWSLRDRIALLVWPAVYSDQWTQAVAVVRDQHVGGVLLMQPTENFAAHLRDRLADLDAVAAHGVAVATDEEGGSVQRLRALEVLPSQEVMSAKSADEIRALVEQHARLLAAAGIDVVFGPVADVRPLKGRDPLGRGRLFLGGPEEVSGLAAIYVRAWESAGIVPVLKHFPGHGSATADTHTARASTPALDVLRTRDLVPYVRLAGSGAAVMVGHLDVPGLTDGRPASLSAAAVDLLRGQLGWGDVLLFTDGLGMAGVGMGVAEAAVRAVQAGVDVAIFTATGETKAVIDALAAAATDGTIPQARIDRSAARVARLLVGHGGSCS
ncbi:MAG: glycoside hydrolase family 3 N-terminal domain-containing protein [Actinomycetota bacterium]